MSDAARGTGIWGGGIDEAPRASVLIVEDDEGLGRLLLDILQKADYKAKWAETGQRGVDLARDYAGAGHTLSAVLIDLQLPDQNGLDILREVKRAHPDVGAIIMTGHSDTAAAVDSLNSGAFAYLEKPFASGDLRAVVARAVERQRLLRENRILLRSLQEANVELERKVQVRTDELHQANLRLLATITELREANELKSQFVTMITHELRTPLTIISGFSEILVKLKADEAERQRFARNIHQGVRQIARLTDDMLELMRIKEKRVELTPARFDLVAASAPVVDEMKAARPDLRFEVAFAPEAREMTADRGRVAQVLRILIGNAVRYSPPGGLVRVAFRRDGPALVASVADSGPGIPEPERGKLFEVFYRGADAVNQANPGSGMGLPIARALMALMGGQVWLEKAGPQPGCTFCFSLPAEPPRA